MGFRHGSDLALLWQLGRPVAAALIKPVAWELPYATGVALKRKGKKKFQGEPSYRKPFITFPHIYTI